jgi:mannose-6-phosphate isomerase class I
LRVKILTVIEGKASLETKNEKVELDTFQTVVVPASLGAYQFKPIENCKALKSTP